VVIGKIAFEFPNTHLPRGAVLKLTYKAGNWTCKLGTTAEKEKGEMKISTDHHFFVTGACGAGKSTLGKALSSQLQLPLHQLDNDPDFRQMLQHDPDVYRSTDPQRYAQWQALRRHLVHEAVKLQQPHIIEGTHILVAPELTRGHRRILVDTPLHQIIRQHLARDRAKYAEDPARYADRHVGAPGSAAARQRALRVRQIYESLRLEIEAFRNLPGVEIVPGHAFKTWLPKQVKISNDQAWLTPYYHKPPTPQNRLHASTLTHVLQVTGDAC
jgi:hypothetical protein